MFNSEKNIKKILYFLLFMHIVFPNAIFSDTTNYSTNKSKSYISDKEVESILIDTAKTINKQTPVRLDEITVMESAMALNKTLTYRYKIDMRGINIQNFRENTDKLLLRDACNLENEKASQKLMFSLGVSYVFMYFDNEGKLIHTSVIDSKKCNK